MEIRDEWDLAENDIDAAKEGTYMDTGINVVDLYVTDREGTGTLIWAVYHGNHVITIEFTKGVHGFTDRVDLPVPVPPGTLPRPWLRSGNV